MVFLHEERETAGRRTTGEDCTELVDSIQREIDERQDVQAPTDLIERGR